MSGTALAALTLREWRTSWTDRSAYILRAIYATLLLLGAGVAWSLHSEMHSSLLRSLFGWFCRGQFVLATALASLTFARSVTREQERGTLDLLLLSPLSKLEILLAKLIGEFLGLVALVLAGVPMVLLLIPLGGIAPSEILTVHAILLAQILGVGGLSVAFAALLGRAAPVMVCTLAAVLLFAAGPGWARAWFPGGAGFWNSLEPISAWNQLELQLGLVSSDSSLAVHSLLAAVMGALLLCALGSLMLERRYVSGGRAPGRLALGRLLRRAGASRRAGWLFRPLGRAEHPLIERERGVDRDPWFRLSWCLLVLGYAVVLRRELLKPGTDWAAHWLIALTALGTAVVLSILLGALSVGADRRRGLLQTFLAVGVSPEDLLRSRWRVLFRRAIYLLMLPAIHWAVLFAREFPEGAWWRIPASLMGAAFGAALMSGITLWFAFWFRRAELAAFAALIVAIPAFLLVAGTLGGHPISMALGLPLVIGALLNGYAALIRRVPRFVLS